MTRTRKLTLSMKEFSHLVSESLDIAHVPVPIPDTNATSSFVNHIPVVSENTTKPRRSSFQRIFARPPPSPEKHDDSGGKLFEEVTESPRKRVAWPFSRSPRKNRSGRDESEELGTHVETEVNDLPGTPTRSGANSMDSITSLAAASTSSLGSLLPAHERLFQVMSKDGFFSEETSSSPTRHSVRVGASSPLTFAQPQDSPTDWGHYGTRTRLPAMFGNRSTPSVVAISDPSTNEPQTEPWCQRRLTQSSGTTATTTSYRDSLSVGETEGSDDDPTPRASTFGNQTKLPPAVIENESRVALRNRSEGLSIVMPPSNTNALVLRPGAGVAPYPPSETESVTTPVKTSRTRSPSPSSPSTRSLVGVTFPHTPSPSPTRSPRPSVPSDITPPPKVVAVCCTGSPRQRPRSLSRTLASPPLPRPPPTGPLPAVPSSVPPVPPLPHLLSKKSTMKMSPQLPICSPSRTAGSGTPTASGTSVATPPSPPGGLRLPSRLSWVNTVRSVLPSPPASPIRASKGRSSPSLSPSKEENRKSGGLKRPTSISVIEAADNGHVRRTKSILLLASRSKSHASLGTTKRVQIHAEANTDPGPPRKPRRKSSAAATGPPMSLGSASESVLTSGGPELLVPRERRHSAPLLSGSSGSGANAPQPSADWTLSLPFCTDVPGNQIPAGSPLLEAQGKSKGELEEPQGDDWTLCMPLKVRLATPTVATSEGCGSVCTTAETTETSEKQSQIQIQMQTQLPTPSPSPTLPSPPSSLRPLEIEETEFEPEPEPRPASPASLGPHAGGLDIDGGRGKRASGWHVYGWFDEVDLQEDIRVPLQLHTRGKSQAASFRRTAYELCGRNLSQDSTFTVSTNGDTVYHSARSSLLVN